MPYLLKLFQSLLNYKMKTMVLMVECFSASALCESLADIVERRHFACSHFWEEEEKQSTLLHVDHLFARKWVTGSAVMQQNMAIDSGHTGIRVGLLESVSVAKGIQLCRL
ncbi:hypothetical protein T4D_7308 [Trichinella pseudospiralis]|uniref:Uncharacterized protein n=1 Tax=Trichinella pseudospiralis TaxID=6337 RepID=A0A0V1FM68_TRIPS|nr:hypothetical protein T4D_7308 [Trichinella pseudospiralis]